MGPLCEKAIAGAGVTAHADATAGSAEAGDAAAAAIPGNVDAVSHQPYRLGVAQSCQLRKRLLVKVHSAGQHW